MPKRKYKSREKINSEEIQGEGSWVIIRHPTWEDFENAKNGTGAEGLGRKIVEEMVDEWNWVDDNNQPLPEPNPEVVRNLQFEEMMFLIEHFELNRTNQKN